MDWVADNLRVLVIIAGAIAYWLNQRRKVQQEEQESQRRPSPQVSPTAEAAEQAERTRRIQEEIRRKILERAGGGQPQVPPVFSERTAEARREEQWQEEGPPPVPVRRQQPEYTPADEAVLARQRALAEKLRELQSRRSEEAPRIQSYGINVAEEAAAAESQSGHLLADLRNVAAARRAMILREVLGPPVALR